MARTGSRNFVRAAMSHGACCDTVNDRTPDPDHPVCPERDGFAVPQGEMWVFGYGSLMWDPGFAHCGAHPALLYGYHRAFCVYSHRYRGTHQQPGLVLGLTRGGACRGMAYRVAARDVRSALNALWLREMPRRTYVPRMLQVAAGPQRVRALAFVADPQHYAYAGKLALEKTAEVIARGRGLRGANIDYLRNTLAHLRELGVRDHGLERLLKQVESCGG
jgi:cation transport protein ChaC